MILFHHVKPTYDFKKHLPNNHANLPLSLQTNASCAYFVSDNVFTNL